MIFFLPIQNGSSITCENSSGGKKINVNNLCKYWEIREISSSDKQIGL